MAFCLLFEVNGVQVKLYTFYGIFEVCPSMMNEFDAMNVFTYIQFYENSLPLLMINQRCWPGCKHGIIPL